jgi:hypothetical protein
MSKGRRIFIMTDSGVVIGIARSPVIMTTHLHNGEAAR